MIFNSLSSFGTPVSYCRHISNEYREGKNRVKSSAEASLLLRLYIHFTQALHGSAGLDKTLQLYAEKHQQELNEFAKAVRYMNANGIKAADYGHIAGELQQLLDEQSQLRAALVEQNVDPDLIDRIRHCVDMVEFLSYPMESRFLTCDVAL